MKHLLCTVKDIKAVPDWALRNKQYVRDADIDTALLCQFNMPMEPTYYAEQVVGGVREVVAWGGPYATDVKVEAK